MIESCRPALPKHKSASRPVGPTNGSGFGEKDDKLYVMTRSDSGKYKRIRNNPKVRIAPCTMRGKITGPEFAATVRILPPEDWPQASKTVKRKYWLARIPFFWSKQNVYLEIDVAT